MTQVSKAARLASLAHAGQFRKYSNSDQAYICHPMRVAGQVSLVPNATNEMIAAAWLHDTIEDTEVDEGLLKKEFGPEVAKLVVEVTNPSRDFPSLKRFERKVIDREYLKSVSNEAKIIKLADSIDNLTDLKNDPLVSEGFKKLYPSEIRQLLNESLQGAESSLELILDEKLKELNA